MLCATTIGKGYHGKGGFVGKRIRGPSYGVCRLPIVRRVREQGVL